MHFKENQHQTSFRQFDASFEAFTAVMFQVTVFWVVATCSVMLGYQHFRGPCCPHLQGEVADMRENSIDICPELRRAVDKYGTSC
jgi:hypothetical protein